MCLCVRVYRLHLGLLEGGFVRDNVVFVMESMKQQELVSLRATAHQSTRLRKRSRKKSSRKQIQLTSVKSHNLALV